MKKYFAISLAFCLFALSFYSTAHVKAQFVQIPNVYVKNIQLQNTDLKTGDTVTGTFQAVTDSAAVVSDIYFTISLAGDYQKNTLAGAFFDSTATASYDIKAGETKTIGFSYTIPQVKTGAGYGIQIQGMTQSGIPLGWSDAFIKITNVGNVQYLDIVSLRLDVGTSTFGLQEGPTIPVGKSAVLDVVVSNPTSQSVTFTPTIDLFNHVVIGDPILTVTASSTTIAAGKQKEFFISLPTNNNAPLVYVSHVSFPDANGVQRLSSVDARYIVQGDIATIQSVATDKNYFNKGDVVNVTLNFSGTPLDITTGDNQSSAVYDTEVKLLDSQNQSLASWSGSIDYNATSSKTVALTAQQAGNGYTVDVTVTKAGKLITHYSTKIASENISVSSSQSKWLYFVTFLILILILAFLVVAAFKSQKHRLLCIVLIVLALIAAYISLTKIQKAWASSGTPPAFVIYSRSADINGTKYIRALTWSSPTGHVMAPGEEFYITGHSTEWACTNDGNTGFVVQAVFNSSTHFFGRGIVKNINTGTYDTYVDGVAVDVPQTNGGTSDFSLGPFTAPSTAGTYRASITAALITAGTLSSFELHGFTTVPSGNVNGIIYYILGYMDFTVVSPPPPSTCTSPQVLVGGVCVDQCTNGADNPSTCDMCTSPQVLVGGVCVDQCTNGAYNPPTCTTYSSCLNGADNPPSCTCTEPQVLVGDVCVDQTEIDGASTCLPEVNSSNGLVPVTFANVGQLVTWQAIGGSGPYVWSGDVIGSPTGSSYQIRYQTTGTKTVYLTTPAFPLGNACTLGGIGGNPIMLPIINNLNWHEI